jgi:hypothetical protein
MGKIDIMVSNSTSTSGQKLTDWFNWFMYVMLSTIAIYFLLIEGDIGMAMSDLGIALIFIPVNHETPFKQLSLAKRIWLLMHLTLVFVLLGLMLIN